MKVRTLLLLVIYIVLTFRCLSYLGMAVPLAHTTLCLGILHKRLTLPFLFVYLVHLHTHEVLYEHRKQHLHVES